MASKKGYSRYFLILQEDEKGYVLDKGKNSSGYVKMEKKSDKCKISYYAQNINPNMGTYYMVLICKDNQTEKMVILGKVVMDGQGKIDMNCEYDIDNIANSKMSMQHIVGAVIAKVSEGNVIPLLTGFVSTPIPSGWKQYKLVNFKEERTEITEEISKDILDIKNREDNKDKNREDNKDKNTEDNKDKNEEDNKDKNEEDGKDKNEEDGKDKDKEDRNIHVSNHNVV